MSRARVPARRGPEGEGEVQARRLRRALIWLLAAALVFLALVLVGRAFEEADRPSVLSEAAALIGGEEADADGDADAGALELLASLDSSDGADDEVPESFQEEVLSTAGREDLRCDASAGIVGFSEEGSAEEVFAQLSAELAEKGWTGVESGLDAAGTFVKGDGDHRWLYLSCVQVGDSTSVVAQVESLEEGA